MLSPVVHECAYCGHALYDLAPLKTGPDGISHVACAVMFASRQAATV